MLLAMTVLLGLAYPLVVTGISQLLLPDRADGSLVGHGGSTVGSELVGQSFAGRPEYFQSRPSAAGGGYDPLASSASNLGPESEVLLTAIEERRSAAAAFDGTTPDAVAPDALTASASGLDPHISPEYAAQQVERVARERGLDAPQVEALIEQYTDDRSWGFLGEPGVNVLLLNLALDRLTQAAD
jgi:K+-transporting ATPase ATPase C chain